MAPPEESRVQARADALARYSRQMLVSEVGEDGQRRLLEARAVLIGCGALGSSLATTLVRAGLGFLRIIDRDYIELNNLQRQVLFDEADIGAGLPKAEAAARKLRLVNSQVQVEGVVADASYRNIEGLCAPADVLLDGTDNFETRYLLNDLAVKTSRPWVYGGVIGTAGLCMAIIPGQTPCLRCVFEQAPPPEASPTCDTAGVLGPAASLVAGFQAVEAMKMLMGRFDAVNRRLASIDAWSGRVTHIEVGRALDQGDCPCCKQRRFDYLDGRLGSSAVRLCGRSAVQVSRPGGGRVAFEQIAAKLAPVAGEPAKFNEFMLKARVGHHEIVVFADGRAIIKGTDSADEARAIYARYVGS